MDPKIKNIIGWLVALVLLVGIYAMFSYVATYSDMARMGAPSFSASGEGKVVGKPDIARFSFQVIDQGDKDVAAVQKINSEKVNAAIDYLKSQGVKAEDISTSGYNIEPRYQYYGCNNGGACPPAQIVGYSITQSIEVKIRDFAKIGSILSGIVTKGVNNVSQLAFAVDDPTQLRALARAQAIEKARKQAEVTAKAAGVGLGRVLNIDEISDLAPQPYGLGGARDMKIMSSEVSQASPAIEPGSTEIKVNVILRYELK